MTRNTTVSGAVPSGPVAEKQSQEKYKIFLIALEDNGKSGKAIGCLDSLVAVDVEAADTRAALDYLLSQRSEYYGQSGLYNPLFRSRLRVVRFFEKEDGIHVDLKGDLSLGGMCDNPRISGQLTATALQTTESTRPSIIRINGELLDDLLSLQ